MHARLHMYMCTFIALHPLLFGRVYFAKVLYVPSLYTNATSIWPSTIAKYLQKRWSDCWSALYNTTLTSLKYVYDTIPNVKTTNLFAISANPFWCCSAWEGDHPVFCRPGQAAGLKTSWSASPKSRAVRRFRVSNGNLSKDISFFPCSVWHYLLRKGL